ncbi:MAG: dTDP-glucose 4,6-dehydratase [Verrucomicrobiales bacterium]
MTGGCGFIGSHFVRLLLAEDARCEVSNVDLLTYAGREGNLEDVIAAHADRYHFIREDIADGAVMRGVFERGEFDAVINLAAESHVDRSISDPDRFVQTNVVGTANLVGLAREFNVARFVQVSTDEVYGSLKAEDEPFTETTPLSPSSPYSASKAGADLLAMAAHRTFGQDVVITRCSNNYGPCQFPEKLIPLMISRALAGEALPVYGDGGNVRDWIHVGDHCRGILAALENGKSGEIYNLGADFERTNLEIVREILEILDKPESLISFVKDRPGHDWRYAINSAKARNELDWEPKHDFGSGLRETIEWYRSEA